MVNHFVDWGRPAEALATIERARSRAFLDLLAETRESEPLGWIEIKALLS